METTSPLDLIRSVHPSLTTVIGPELMDLNGHMNVRHYFDLQERALTEAFDLQGLDDSYVERTGNGVFTLEQHITYLDECLEADEISVHIRIVAVGDHVLHTVNHLVNNTRGTLSQMLENIIGHADLRARKLTPWPTELRERLESLVDASGAQVPLSGRLGLR